MPRSSALAGLSIHILPLGEEIENDVIEIIASNLQVHFSLPVTVLAGLPLPRKTFNSQRNQYNALDILKFMQSRNLSSSAKILGVANVDLFIPIFTYVFGEAQLEQSCALVSLWRLSRNRDGSSAPLPLFLERAAKLAVHELAHTFNLPHCKEEDCIMKFLPDLQAVDEQDLILCRYCSIFLEDKIQGTDDSSISDRDP